MGAGVKLKRLFTRIRVWWNEPIRVKPVLDHNRKQIKYTKDCPLVQITARLVTVEGRLMIKSGNSGHITLDPASRDSLTKQSRTVQVHNLEIEKMTIYDTKGEKTQMEITSETAILATRLINPDLEKAEAK